MPLNRDAPRESMEKTYTAMRIVTSAKYDGVTLDDYSEFEPVADENVEDN